MVTLVDHKNVGYLHDAGFDRLHIVSHARDQNHDGDVGDADNIDFVLPHPDGFNHDDVTAGSIEHRGNVGRCTGEPAEPAARRHAANVNALVGEVVLHANTVAQNRASGVRTGGIDGDDADFLVICAIQLGKLIDQSAFAHTR